MEKDPDLPFTIRKRVAEACIFSTILYGCETWRCSDFNKLEPLYMRVVKALLAVRETTCNDLCLIESGVPSLRAAIQEKQQKYMCKKIEILGEDSPLGFALKLAESANTASYKRIKSVLSTSDILNKDKQKIQGNIRLNITSIKRVTYICMNPSLKSPTIYDKDDIDEYKRKEYTRWRL